MQDVPSQHPSARRRETTHLAAALLACVAVFGCNESTSPPASVPDGGAEFDGKLDPTSSGFVLKRIESPLPGREFVRVDLIGSNVRTDPNTQTVSIDVALQNAGDQALHVPAIVWLHRFIPASVMPINADVERDEEGGPEDSTGTSRVRAWGFDYSDLLGADGVLEPGESSARKTWQFSDPGLVSFAFAAQAHFGMQPDRPQLSGFVFHDENRNGRRDRGEGPFHGAVNMTTPDNEVFTAHVGTDGRYRFALDAVGLYQLLYFSVLRDGEPQPDPTPPPHDPRILVCVTTPNPLEVLVVAGPDGQPMSFEHADFGVAPGPCGVVPPNVPLLAMTDRRPEDIEQDPYSLMAAKLEGDILTLRVGISGCSPDHPFALFASRGFMESNPVQTWALLAHDDRGEFCDAWFERTLQFDLAPLRSEHIRAYGRPGVVILRFRDFHGNETRFEFGP